MSKLLALDEKRQRARKARIYCEGEVAKHGAGQQMCPYPCGIICMKVSTVPCEIVIFLSYKFYSTDPILQFIVSLIYFSC